MTNLARGRRLAAALLTLALAFSLLAFAAPARADVGEPDHVGLFDPATGEWHLRNADGSVNVFSFGTPGDRPLMGDWDCDGIDTVGMFRSSTGFVYLRNSNTAGPADISFTYGAAGDIALAGDWNNNGCDTISAYRAGQVRIINSLGTATPAVTYWFGMAGDVPFSGDFSGNGVSTMGLYRSTTGFVYFRNSHTTGFADFEFFYGIPSDRILSGDWDGDGDETVGIFRPGDATFYLSNANAQGAADVTVALGSSGFFPVAGNHEIIVVAPPEAFDDAFDGVEGDIVLGNVLDNDVSGAPVVTAAVVSQPAFGILVLDSDGSFTYTHDGSENHADGFTYEATNDGGTSNLGTVVLTIDPVNDNAPNATADLYDGVSEGGTLVIDVAEGVLANDSDEDLPGDPLTAVLDADATLGTVTLETDGSFTYTHDGSETTTDSFTYFANDGISNSDPQTVSITISPVNDDPIANDDGGLDFIADEDNPVTTGSVLANDSDPDAADTLSVQSFDDTGAAGTVTDNGDGTFEYDPAGLFEGLAEGQLVTDTFTYTATDGNGGTATAVVPMTVVGVNDAPVAGAVSDTASEDGAVVTGSFGGDDVDSDDDASTLTYAITGSPAEGSAALGTVNGTFDFDPGTDFQDLAAGETRPVTFTYTATDSHGAISETGTVTITITGVNDAPTAADNTVTTDEGTPFTPIGVLGNDTDPDTADILVVSGFDDALTTGTVIDNGNGTFNYDPAGQFEALAAGESTTDTFTYTISDGNGGTDAATVTITITGVNDAPTAADNTVTTDEDTTHVFTAADFTFTDVDTSDTLTKIQITLLETVGSLALDGNPVTLDQEITRADLDAGLLVFIPNPNQNGAEYDSFDFKVHDGTEYSAAASYTITIDITPINDAPIGVEDSGVDFETNEDSAFTTGDVLANDTDVDAADTLSVQSFDDTGTVGTVTDNGNGTFDYDPAGLFETLAPGETATDTFTYTVSDGNGGTAMATVSITVSGVNDDPVAGAVSDTASEDGAVITGSFDADDVDSDDDASTLLYAITGSPAEGSAALGTVNGTFDFDPGTDFQDLAVGETRPVTFTYTATDSHGAISETGTVTITVSGVNDAPVAGAVSDTASEDGAVVTGSFGGDDVDSDDDASTLTYAITGSPAEGSAALGTVNGTFDFDPGTDFQDLAAGETRPVTFTYTATDSHGAISETGTVTITITGVNDAPTAADNTVTTDEGTPFTPIGVLGNDTDPDTADILVVSGFDDALTTGTVIDNGNGTFNYDPAGQFEALAAGESTTDTFTYTISDGNGGTDAATVTITITGVNDAPTAADNTVTTDEDTTHVFTAADFTFTDVDTSDTLTKIQITLLETVGSLALDGNPVTLDQEITRADLDAGLLVFIPNPNQNGAEYDSFDFKVHDGTEYSAAASYTITIDITPINDAPIATTSAGTAAFVEDAGPVVVDGSFTVSDIDDALLESVTVTITNLLDGAAETLAATPSGGIFSTDISYAAGVLTISGPATVADFQAVVQSITYANSDDTPNTTLRLLSFVADDGTDLSSEATKNLSVAAVNDAPTVDMSGALSAYAEGSGAVTIDPGASLTDPDSNFLFGLTVQITSGAEAGVDTLACPDCAAEGLFSVFGGNKLTLVGFSTAESYQAALQSVTFSNASDNPSGADRTLTIIANDGIATSTPVTVTFSITGANDSPVANADAYAVSEGAAVTTIAGTGVAANDTDPEDTIPSGDVTLVTGPAHHDGTFTLAADGSFTYTHDGSETTTDSFTYNVQDSAGATSNTATVSITITGANDLPVAVDDAYAVSEGAAVTTIAGTGVAANDTDPEDTIPSGDVTLVTGPAHHDGTFTLATDGSFTYSHDGSETTTDSFTYTVRDAAGAISNIATVTITITPVNDAPTAADDPSAGTIDASEGGATAVIDVLANDTDPDDGIDPASVIATDGAHGTTTVNLDGTIVYTHDGSDTAIDSFTYTVKDAAGAISNTATVTITITPVNDAPTAVDDPAAGTAPEGGATGSINVLANDTDPDDGIDPASVIATDGAHGTTTVNLDGTIVYTHDGSETTNDSFTYTVKDAAGAISNVATVSITITPVNDAPTVDMSGAIVAYTEGDGAVTVVPAASVIDPDSNFLFGLTIEITSGAESGVDTLACSACATEGIFSVFGGNKLTLVGFASPASYEAALQSVTFSNASESPLEGPRTLAISANDGIATSTPVTVTFSVGSVNTDPVLASIGPKSGDEGTELAFTATASDADLPANTLTFTLDGEPSGATITAGGVFSWTPSEAQGPGEYTFDVIVSDGALSDSETITVTVAEVNIAPELGLIGAKSGDEGTELAFTVTASDADLPANTLTFTLDGEPSGATITAGGVFSWTPSEAQGPGEYTFDVIVSDGALSDSETITVTVTEVNDNAPTITGGDTALLSVVENTTAVTDVEATDGDGDTEGAGLTYSLTDDDDTGPNGADNSLFTLDPATGVLTFNELDKPDFEDPGDADAGNDYEVQVTVTDSGGLTDTQNLTVTVTGTNDAPVITSNGGGATAVTSVAENTTAVTDVQSTDEDGFTEGFGLAYSLTTNGGGGADNGRFTLNTATGVLTFQAAPDFEAPGDADLDNDYLVQVTVTDGGGLTDTQNLTVTVDEVDDNSPVWTSSDTPSLDENTTTVVTLAATDDDLPADTITFTITGGDDQALFEIVAGVLKFKDASVPDFEAPGDANGDNDYLVTVTANDGTTDVAQNLTVTVDEVDDNSPVWTSSDTPSLDENTTTVVTLAATDDDLPADTITFTITGGDDQALFEIVAGVLKFKDASVPDFEAPGDANGDNDYLVTVTANDGTTDVAQNLTVTVDEVDDNSPVWTSSDTPSLDENTTTVVTLAATDDDLPADTITFTITGGDDQALFEIVAGVLKFKDASVPDFEAPGDANGDNDYLVTVTANDGTTDVAQNLTVTVDEVDDNSPVWTSSDTPSLDENTTTVVTLAATDDDLPADTITFTITGGDDQALFEIVAGVLKFKDASVPDFEAPGDANGDNDYLVTVTANDGTTDVAQNLTVTVDEVDDNSPVWTSSDTPSLDENTTTVVTLAATDDDLPADTITFTITGGDDQALFEIVAGVLKFKDASVPDFEAPGDANGDNDYLVTVTANDGTTDVAQNLTVTVDEVDDNSPVWTSSDTPSLDENTTTVVTLAATDDDLPADTITFTITGGDDQALFEIVAGVLKFKDASVPDFEAPADANGDNDYLVTVTANDGTTDVAQNLTVTVDEVDDNSPVWTSSDTPSLDENTTTVVTLAATDDDLPADTITFTITGGDDQALFEIVAGVLKFKDASVPDFEAPADANGDNDYLVTVTANDGTTDVAQNLTVTVDDSNEFAPVVDAGQDLGVDEDALAGATVGTVTFTDADSTDVATGFTIVSGDTAGSFLISSTGVITLADPTGLDYETNPSYTLSVSVTDTVNSDAAAVDVTITIGDINDAPTATDKTVVTGEDVTYTFGASNFNFADEDGDTLAKVQITSLETAGSLVLDGVDVILNQEITKADIDAFKLKFVPGAEESGSGYATFGFKVSDGALYSVGENTMTVDVIELNDHAPVVDAGQDLGVDEDALAGATVGTVTFTDADSTDVATGFTIVSGDTAGSFLISSTGVITLADPTGLDYETNPSYTLSVSVTDTVNSDAAAVDVTITIGDVNDNAPVVDAGQDLGVDEDALAGATVGTVTFTDADSTDVATGFTIVSGDTAGSFLISSTGVITLADPTGLDYETNPSYTLSVSVTDTVNSDAAAVDVTITIGDVNDNAPVVDAGQDLGVDEDALAGATVGTVTFTDADSTDVATGFTIVSGDTAGSFLISSTGVITLADPTGLDYETNPSYTLSVSVTDTVNSDAAAVDVTITIGDVNDNAPVVDAGQDLGVDEDALAGATVGTVTFTDADSTDVATGFTIVSGDTAGSFLISSTGVITLADPTGLDYETNPSYTLSVSVTDTVNSDAAAVDVTITIGDVNDNAPVVDAGQDLGVDEDALAGATVGTVTFTDADSTDVATGFTIVSGDTAGSFLISSTGVITLADPTGLDYETNPSYTLSVSVTDTVNSDAAAVDVTITIGDVNDNAPVVDAGQDLGVDEDALAGATVGTVTFTDADSTDVATGFTIVSGDTAGSFLISSTGVITLADPTGLDYETNPSYTLSVSVTDTVNSDAAAVDVTITIGDVNDNAPVVDAGQDLGVDEDALAGATVGTVTFTDADSTDVATGFTIVSGDTAGSFLISSTGVITLADPTGLDYETNPSYTLSVSVTDTVNSDAAAVDVTITIGDVNDNAPVVDAGQDLGVDEDALAGATVGTVTFTDADSTDVATGFTIVSGDTAGSFLISSTGVITLADPTGLDYETNPSYTLSVSVTDTVNSDAAAVDVTITIGDVNDNAPVVDAGQDLGVDEDALAGATVGTVTFTDADSTDVATGFTIVSGDTAGSFLISSTGVITLADPTGLDYETNPSYTLSVSVTDTVNSDAAAVDVTITIGDVNDNAPVVDAGQDLGVDEDALAGATVGTVTFTDADSTDVATGFTIVSGDTAGSFLISSTGVITLADPTGLDYETNPSYTLSVSVTDTVNSDAAAVDVTITIGDVNDNAPVVDAGQDLGVDEDALAGATVGTVTFTDADSTDVATGFTIVSGDTAGSFLISSTGVITLADPTGLDYETNPSYTLSVSVTDTVNSDAAAVDVTITIGDVNDNAPVVDAGQDLGVDEDALAGATVGTVTFTDADSTDVATGFTIVSGDTAGSFLISSTGVITLADPTGLDYETNPSYTLSVSVTDTVNSDAAAVDVTITIGDVNDNAPVVDAGQDLGVDEDALAGATVGTVTFTDADSTDVATGFTIVSGDTAGSFLISSTGVITLADPTGLDYETNPSYTLSVSVTDTVNSDAAAVDVTITIGDVNDNAPVVDAGQDLGVDEDALAGATVGTVTFTDADSTDVATGFTIVSGDTAGSFLISSTGVITLADPTGLDYETNPSYTLSVSVTDTVNSDAAAVDVTITIGDVNDNAPVVDAGQDLGVDEDALAGATVGTVTFTDADSTDVATGFTIVSGDTAGSFLISSTGVITLADPTGLDYETNPSYTLSVSVTDTVNSDAAAVDVTITIGDVNDAPTISTNSGLPGVVDGSTGNVISSAELEASDADTAAADLIYTLTTEPTSGTLRLDGVALTTNDMFTQADINAGLLTYDDTVGGGVANSFEFTVSDGTTVVGAPDTFYISG